MKEVSLESLSELVRTLRSENGCPWDRRQDHRSIKKYLFEEAAEVADAIDAGDMELLRDELGDLLFQVLFHSGMAEEAGHFTLRDVASSCIEKMRRRHPHVFGDEKFATEAEMMARWEQIKRAERKSGPERRSLLDRVARNLPAVRRAESLQQKAAGVGFDWPSADGVIDKIREEIGELIEERKAGADRGRLAEELGDLMFSVVNLGRFLGLDCEDALRAANDKFYRRFSALEEFARTRGLELSRLGPDELDALWREAKASDRAQDFSGEKNTKQKGGEGR